MRDLSRLARKLQMDNMKMIAREQLEIDETDIENIAVDCREKPMISTSKSSRNGGNDHMKTTAR